MFLKKSGINIESLFDELTKIAVLSVPKPATSKSFAVKNTSLTNKPKVVSKPVVIEKDPPSATLDHLSSTRSIMPPPITAA